MTHVCLCSCFCGQTRYGERLWLVDICSGQLSDDSSEIIQLPCPSPLSKLVSLSTLFLSQFHLSLVSELSVDLITHHLQGALFCVSLSPVCVSSQFPVESLLSFFIIIFHPRCWPLSPWNVTSLLNTLITHYLLKQINIQVFLSWTHSNSS